jgi:hypothetical protein
MGKLNEYPEVSFIVSSQGLEVTSFSRLRAVTKARNQTARLVVSQEAEFESFADDILAERTARTLIIVGASRVDILLLAILDAYLLPKRVNDKDPDELLEGDRGLSSFSARIKLCYRLGLIDESLRKTLETLRALRNPSAHHVIFDITQSPAREHVIQLRGQVCTRKSFQLAKERFFLDQTLNAIEELQCMLLTICLLLESIRKLTGRTSGNKTTLRISQK